MINGDCKQSLTAVNIVLRLNKREFAEVKKRDYDSWEAGLSINVRQVICISILLIFKRCGFHGAQSVVGNREG